MDELNSELVEQNGVKKWMLPNGYLHRLDGPAIEWADGGKAWFVNGGVHRIDGPALEHANGSQAWWVNSKRHRLDGPAIDLIDGSKEWWVNGNRVEDSWLEENGFVAPLTSEQQVLLMLRWGGRK